MLKTFDQDPRSVSHHTYDGTTWSYSISSNRRDASLVRGMQHNPTLYARMCAQRLSNNYNTKKEMRPQVILASRLNSALTGMSYDKPWFGFFPLDLAGEIEWNIFTRAGTVPITSLATEFYKNRPWFTPEFRDKLRESLGGTTTDVQIVKHRAFLYFHLIIDAIHRADNIRRNIETSSIKQFIHRHFYENGKTPLTDITTSSTDPAEISYFLQLVQSFSNEASMASYYKYRLLTTLKAEAANAEMITLNLKVKPLVEIVKQRVKMITVDPFQGADGDIVWIYDLEQKYDIDAKQENLPFTSSLIRVPNR